MRRSRRATSSASPFDGSSGTERSERELASAAPSSRETMLSIIAYCLLLARTSRLLLATFTRMTGGVSVPSSVSKMSARLFATSLASPLRMVMTRTVRSLSVPGATSSWRSISSAASSAVGVAEITTALRRSSAITRSAGSEPAAAAARPRARAPSPACAASLASSCSTSGAICPARACLRNTVRTRAASRGPRTSMSRTVFSISSSCAGSAATTIELLVSSGVMVGFTRPGRVIARVATACSIAFATVSAAASESG